MKFNFFCFQKIHSKCFKFQKLSNISDVKYKFFAFFVFCVATLCVVSVPEQSKVLLKKYLPYQNSTYCFYTQNTSFDIPNTSKIENGAENIIKCQLCFANETKQKLDVIFGESICLQNYDAKQKDSVLQSILPIAKKIESVGDIQIFYCYDFELPRFVCVFGKKINLQVAISKNAITVGYPLILGDY